MRRLSRFVGVFVAVGAMVVPSLHAQSRGRKEAPLPTPPPAPAQPARTQPAPAPPASAGPTVQQRNVSLSRSQIDTLSKQIASTTGKSKSKFGLSMLTGDESRETAAKQLLEAEASQVANRGTTAVVVIGNDGDVTKVKESLTAVQRDVLLLFVDDSVSDDTTDNAALKGGLAGKVSGMATNMWVYMPSSGGSGTRKPNQTLSTKVATPKLWSGIFASNGDLPPEAQNALNGQGRSNADAKPAEAPAASGAAAPKSAGAFAQGDVLAPKIAGVKLMATPDDAGKVAGTLAKTDEVVVIGDEKNGFVNVQGSSAAGWVKIVLVQKH